MSTNLDRKSRREAPAHQVAAAELYVYRLRHRGVSIDEVAADLHVSPCRLRAWVSAYWRSGS